MKTKKEEFWCLCSKLTVRDEEIFMDSSMIDVITYEHYDWIFVEIINNHMEKYLINYSVRMPHNLRLPMEDQNQEIRNHLKMNTND